MAEPGGDDDAATRPGSGSVGLAETLLAPGLRDYAELTAIEREHYIVSGELARGGMGRILAARDRRLGRPVAIKELLGDDDDLRMRFEREARITARLQHPAIVNVLEAGTWPNGEPFYVMRLVVGESLEKAIAGCTTLRERLALLPNVIAAVDALAYAHSLRIIHRDLKPHNVLVGEFGETVVIDWGLAKDLGEIEAPRSGMSGTETVAGSVMGTPAYMPIEQAEGAEVTERADVYALGAMLYHLLSGVAPYAGASSAEIIAAVVSGPPAPLAAKVDGVPSDLLAIVDKAMAYKAEDRYATASELAVDLKKFQTGQLVGAHAYSTWQLLRRWIGKHRVSVAVATVAVALLGIVGAFSVRRILREQARTELSRNEAEDLSGFMLTDLHDKLQPLGKLDLLDDVGKKVVSYYDGRGADLSDAELRNRALAQRNQGDVLTDHGRIGDALKLYRASLATAQAIADAVPDDIASQRDLRFSKLKVAQALAGAGDAEAALAMAREAHTIDARMLVRHPNDVEWAWYSAMSHEAVGEWSRATGKTTDARAELTEMCDEISALLARGPEGRVDLPGPAGRVGPPMSVWRSDLARCQQRLGSLWLVLGDTARAATLLKISKAGYEAALAEEPMNLQRKRDVGTAHAYLADLLRAHGHLADAVSEQRTQLEINQQLATSDPTNSSRQSDVASVHSAIGDALTDEGEFEAAKAEYQSAIEILTTLTARDSSSIARVTSLAVAYKSLGELLKRRGELDGEDAAFRKELAILIPLQASQPESIERLDDISLAHEKLGELAEGRRDYDGAMREFSTEIEQKDIVCARDPNNAHRQRDRAVAHDHLGRLHMARGRFSDALAQFQIFATAIAPLAAADPTNVDRQMDLAWSHQHLSNAEGELGKGPESRLEIDAAIAIFNRLASTDPDNVVVQEALQSSLQISGTALVVHQEFTPGEQRLRGALEIARRLLARDPQNLERQTSVMNLEEALGGCLSYENSPDAQNHLRASIEICEAQANTAVNYRHQTDCDANRERLAHDLTGRQQLDQARTLLQAALVNQSKLFASDPRDERAAKLVQIAHFELAHVAEARGDTETSFELYRLAQGDLAAAVARSPDNDQLAFDLMQADIQFADKLLEHHGFGEALRLAREGGSLADRLFAKRPDSLLVQQLQSQSVEEVGDALFAVGQVNQAIDVYRRFNTLNEQIVITTQRNPIALVNLSEAKERLGDALSRGDAKAAHTSYGEAFKLLQDLQTSDPNNALYTDRAAAIQKKLAKLRPN